MVFVNGMKKGVALLVVLVLMSFAMAHKFYLSVTNVVYSEKDRAFQLTSRLFIDDLEQVLEERYGVEAHLATDEEAKISDTYIEKYLRTKFVVEINGETVQYAFLGREYQDDVVICYMELADINFADLKTMTVQNEILTDLFDEQQNVVHFKWMGQKKSFVLIKQNNKGMLNF